MKNSDVLHSAISGQKLHLLQSLDLPLSSPSYTFTTPKSLCPPQRGIVALKATFSKHRLSGLYISRNVRMCVRLLGRGDFNKIFFFLNYRIRLHFSVSFSFTNKSVISFSVKIFLVGKVRHMCSDLC